MTTPIGQADVFISHAHEDKEVARPLAEALRQRGLKVWYDEYVLRLGDSMREAIERGLATARFGVVILSPKFFAKKWPQRELNALLARETAKGTKVLLPVWHNLTADDIMAHSPILADRLAVSTAEGLSFVVEQILQVLEHEKASDVNTVPTPPPPGPPSTPLPSPGKKRVHKADGSVLVYVPGGEYVLGADDISENEKPVHRVVLSPFWIGKYQVTNEQYGRFLSTVPGTARPGYWHDKSFNQPRQPVVGVSWDQARAYCSWAGLALPSEAQWEAAARGRDRRRYPWGNEEPTAEHANFDGNSGNKGKTTAVGSFPRGAGPFGTLDQAGNVWEWCEDVWDEKAYQGREGAENPVNNGGDKAVRCRRGGSWYYRAGALAAAFRVGLLAVEAGDRPVAVLWHEERAKLLSVLLPALDREPLLYIEEGSTSDGYPLTAVYGEQGLQIAGWLDRSEPRWAEGLHILEAVIRSPWAL
ncbi:MAG TPA: SUMF1/EgtB/PvdO family nonheme iron enzyme, partial [Thermoanaerobaculia bacterium]|nr:SUMF1/EgtB/PvdO family nonheme iron enzyme [Thermoanaerobaculia bacterium]